MVRNRASAKKAGADLEIGQETYWREILRQPQIHRGRNQGIHDKGDLLGVEIRDFDTADNPVGHLTIECKNESTVKLGTWWKEAEAERRNNLATWYIGSATELVPSPAAIIIHKRHGYDVKKSPGKQWVTLTVEELIALIRGNRDHILEEEP